MIHDKPHPLADKTVILARGGWAPHPFKVYDWWDLVGEDWRTSADPRAASYRERRQRSRNAHALPDDDEVVLGMLGIHLQLVHASELPDETSEEAKP